MRVAAFGLTAAIMAIGLSMTVMRTECGNTMFRAMLTGATQLILDHDALSVL